MGFMLGVSLGKVVEGCREGILVVGCMLGSVLGLEVGNVEGRLVIG